MTKKGQTEVEVRVRSVTKDQPTRPDPRSERTVEEILAATFRLLSVNGREQLNIRAVCAEANISRGTFYRYFKSKEDLMEAAARHLRDKTDRSVAEAVAKFDNPADRFGAFLYFTLRNPDTLESSHMLDTEPEFMVRYFKENFGHFVARIVRVLDPVYDAWEEELGGKIDREIISELFVRFALSATLVPPRENMTNVFSELRKIAGLVHALPDEDIAKT